ncbi:hypothetical protein ACFOGJ_13575 [Marinibaculum pumilum]|uniref:Uncharacterized protein n=1 Tax=Marinibaculum pumilum TaxID=1766165 RepID=A0ABV7L1J1_9PROT
MPDRVPGHAAFWQGAALPGQVGKKIAVRAQSAQGSDQGNARPATLLTEELIPAQVENFDLGIAVLFQEFLNNSRLCFLSYRPRPRIAGPFTESDSTVFIVNVCL